MRRVFFRSVVISACFIFGLLGCQSASQVSQGSKTAGDNADGSTLAVQGAEMENTAYVNGNDAQKLPPIPFGSHKVRSTCMASIAQMTPKTDGNIEVLTADGHLWNIDITRNHVNLVYDFKQPAEQLRLLPTNGLILEVNDGIMVKSSVTNNRLLKLKARDNSPAYISTDLATFALHETDTLLHIWDINEKFSKLTDNQQVLEYLHKQSPSYNLNMPNEIVALDMGTNRRSVVVIDDAEAGTKGMLFFHNPEVNRSELKSLGRTNNLVRSVKLSPDGMFVALIDESHALKVTSTQTQGFLPWTQPYSSLYWVTWGADKLYAQANGEIIAVQPNDGTVAWKSNSYEYYTQCTKVNTSLICHTQNFIDVLSEQDGKLEKRLLFTAESYGVLFQTGLEGSLPAECVES